ncbi:hypothetical protein [Novosphingobium sp.]|uniref:hypothetical protein n=1 Tax=Novosphingobium sp. TaxID=1874826 RepID=UPI0025DACEEA|nr:hypothetical protein [Novosphingobium sp.]
MKFARLFGMLALGAAIIPAIASADDPNDRDMRDPRNRARDKAIIRQLNVDQLAHVRERDARYAEGWKAYRQQGGRSEAYANDRADYEQQRAAYERKRAAWRRAVAMCQSGHYEYCDG